MKRLAVAFLALPFCSCGSESPREIMGYHPFSTSVVEVTFDSNPADTVWLSALTENNIPHIGQRSEEMRVAKSGVYYLSLITDRPSSGFLKFNDETFNLILLPNDTVFVSATVDEGGTDLSFSGRGSEINEYYKAKKATLGYTDLRFPINLAITSTASYESVRNNTDSLIENELAFFSNYASEKELPLWFREYEEAEIRYLGLSVATSLPHNNELLNYFEDELPQGYYSFIKKEMVDNPKAMLSSHYLWFLDEYFITDLPAAQLKDIGSFSTINTILEHTLKRSKSELTGEIRALYHKYLFCSIIRFFRDSTSIDSLARVYEVKDYDELRAAAGIRSKNNLPALGFIQGDTIPAIYAVNEMDSMISLRDYSDKILYINFWATWCGPCIKNIPALNEMVSSYANREEIRFINICLDSEKERWVKSVARYKLKGDNLFAEGNWNNKLRAIFDIKGIPTYVLIDKGNVIYQNHTSKAPEAKRVIDTLRLRNTLSW